MSDRANGGVNADNGTRKDLGMFELLSYTPKLGGERGQSLEVVTDVDLDLSACMVTVCKRNLTFCQPVRIGPEDCG